MGPDQTAPLGAIWSGFIELALWKKCSGVPLKLQQTKFSGQNILTGKGFKQIYDFEPLVLIKQAMLGIIQYDLSAP